MWVLAGMAVGLLNGLFLCWTVARVRPHAAGNVVSLLGGFLMRLGLAGGLLLLAIRSGVGAALLAFAGLWLARWVVIWWANRFGERVWVGVEE